MSKNTASDVVPKKETFRQKVHRLMNPKPHPRPPPVPEHAPRYRYDTEPFCYWSLAKSLEVVFSITLVAVSCWLLLFVTGEYRLLGGRGLVQRSRYGVDAAADGRPRTLNADLAIMCLAGMAMVNFLLASARVVDKEQSKLEERIRAEEAVLYNTSNAMETALADRLKQRAALAEENKKRIADQLPTKRESITSRRIMVENVISQIAAAAATVMSVIFAVAIMSRFPNEAHGLGAVVVLFILVGAVVAPHLDGGANTFRLYCGFWQNAFVGCLLLLAFFAYYPQ